MDKGNPKTDYVPKDPFEGKNLFWPPLCGLLLTLIEVG